MSKVFTVDDVRLLEKTISIREKMIDEIVKKELPTKARDIDATVNLLESVDRSIFSKAKISIDESIAASEEANKTVLKELLLSLHSGSTKTNEVDRELPVFTPRGTQLNDGELINGTDDIDSSQYV